MSSSAVGGASASARGREPGAPGASAHFVGPWARLRALET
jgi:hypothetical protein